MADLTPKQQRFVEEYLVDLNATKAAERAGYSPKTAGSQGHDLLKKPEIAEALSKEQQKRAERVHVSQDYVLRRLLEIADSDLAEAYDEAGNLLPIAQMPKHLRMALEGLDCIELKSRRIDEEEEVSTHMRKLKLSPKIKALDLLGRHLGMWTDRVVIEDQAGLAERLAERRRRAQEKGDT
jgi:phage terminase small subunit